MKRPVLDVTKINNMAASNYTDLVQHLGHNIECVGYGKSTPFENVALECVDCNEVLMDYYLGEEVKQ